MKRTVLLLFLGMVAASATVPPAAADPIMLAGSSAPTNWAGTQARLNVISPPPAVTGWIDHHNTNLPSATGVQTGSGSSDPVVRYRYYGYSNASPNQLDGEVHAGGLDTVGGPLAAMTGSGYFRDEIYFEVTSSPGGSLHFDFDLKYFLQAIGHQSGASLTLELWLGPQGTGRRLDQELFSLSYSDDENDLNEMSLFEGTVTLSTGPVPLESAAWFPFTFVAKAETWGGIATWDLQRPRLAYVNRRATPTNVRVLDLEGVPLASTAYSLYSAEPVSEPATLILLGAGLAGLGSRLRRLG